MYKEIIFIFCLFLFAQWALWSQTIIKSTVIANGASSMGSSNIRLLGTVGQAVINNCSSTSLMNSQGFWHVYRSQIVKTNDPIYSLIPEIKLFPNPVISKAFLEFELKDNQKFEIIIIDAFGSKIKKLDNTLWPAGEHTIPLELNVLSSGIYYILMKSQYYNIKIPFMKID